jgi:hypothetical protein
VTTHRTLVLAFFVATCFVPIGATAQIQDQEHKVYQITVTIDTERRIYSWSNQLQSLHTFGGRGGLTTTPSYCSTESFPEMQILHPPLHGTIRLSTGNTLPPYCPNWIKGIVVFYKPALGFVGRDQFTVQRKGDWRSNGLDREFTFVVTVQ